MMTESAGQQEPTVKSEIWEWAKALIIAVGIVLIIRWFFFTPTVVSGSSMEPNFSSQERIIVNKIIYSMEAPERGEVIVFHAPEEKDYIKRVIALPGDSIMVRHDEVYVNGELIAEPYIQDALDEARRNGTSYNRYKNFKVTDHGIEPAIVPEGHYFVMGDNRTGSRDSRDPSVGFVPSDQIVGRADLIFWPLTEIRWIHHP
jgi:signal peptidase I